jgi:hypothetical protein
MLLVPKPRIGEIGFLVGATTNGLSLGFRTKGHQVSPRSLEGRGVNN